MTATPPAADGPPDLRGAVVYGDFNCPFSALAHRRVIRRAQLDRQDPAPIEWRAVEHDPDIPAGGSDIDEASRSQFEGELEQIRSLLGDDEPDVARVPSRRLNTAKLNVLCASVPISQRGEFVQAVFDAYWIDDQDLNDPDALARFGVTATPEGEQRARQWQAEWTAFERRIVPMMRLPDGTPSRGLGALARLR